MEKIIKFQNEAESRSMRWLQSACSKASDNPSLEAIHVENGQTVATDGYQMHIAPTPKILEDQEGKNLIPQSKIKVRPSPLELIESEYGFPDWKRIIPADNRETIFEIGIRKQFLAALKDMPTGNADHVVLKFGPDKRDAILVEPPESEREVIGHKAIIMPVITRDNS